MDHYITTKINPSQILKNTVELTTTWYTKSHKNRWTNFANRLVIPLSDKRKKAVGKKKCLAIKNIRDDYLGLGSTEWEEYVPLAEKLKANVETQNHQRKAAYPPSNWHDFIYMKSNLDILSRRNALMSV